MVLICVCVRLSVCLCAWTFRYFLDTLDLYFRYLLDTLNEDKGKYEDKDEDEEDEDESEDEDVKM